MHLQVRGMEQTMMVEAALVTVSDYMASHHRNE
jgi:hypothetical protein